MSMPASASAPVSLKLPRPVTPAMAADIEKAAVYFSTDLDYLRINDDFRSLTFGARPGSDVATLAGKVERGVGAMLAVTREVATTVHYRRQGRLAARDVNGELQRRGWVFVHGQGLASLSGPALRLMQHLDARFAALYRERFGATDRMYPAMVSPQLLARVGYLGSHPDTTSFVCHMVEDFDELERFRQENTEGFNAPVPGAMAPPHRCLNPAACFPCYESFQDRQLAADGLALTWTGRVFRYESRNMTGLDRLWEFNVRELVFLGSEDFTFDARRRAVALVQELAEEWDLDCRIETASDAFFPTVYGAQSFWQRVKDVKYEIRLAVEPAADGSARSIAAGSINMHGPFFGDRFGIRLPDGERASSACVGWGLERWVLALFSQHGFDPSRWPAPLRTIFD